MIKMNYSIIWFFPEEHKARKRMDPKLLKFKMTDRNKSNKYFIPRDAKMGGL